MREIVFILNSLIWLTARLLAWVTAKIADALAPSVRLIPGYVQPVKQGKPSSAFRTELPKEVLPAVLSRPAEVANAVVPDPLVLATGQQFVAEHPGTQNAVKVSNRVITIPIQAQTGLPIGTAWIYLYEGHAKRLLKFHNRSLAKIFCGPNELRYFFGDVPFRQDEGTEAITKSFVAEIGSLLNRKKEVPKKVEVTAEPKRTEVAVPQPKPVPKAEVKAVETPAEKPVQHPAKVANRSVEGETHEGLVVSCAPTWKPGRNGGYKTFCLTLNNGSVEIPFSGVEIERQAHDLGLTVGDKVRVVDMGRTSVKIPGQVEPGHKNLYQVTRLGVN